MQMVSSPKMTICMSYIKPSLEGEGEGGGWGGIKSIKIPPSVLSVNPFTAEFLKWILPSLNVFTSIVAYRGFSKKKSQCRSG